MKEARSQGQTAKGQRQRGDELKPLFQPGGKHVGLLDQCDWGFSNAVARNADLDCDVSTFALQLEAMVRSKHVRQTFADDSQADAFSPRLTEGRRP
jgi:hypothetical protein